jgi:drug/metabolite transporter (DMT)-like permease
LVVAVIAALAAGCMFAVGSVLQQSAARLTAAEKSLSWRLLLDLAQRRRWLLGIGSDAVSFGLQALALAFGPLALVQPLAVSGLLFAVPLAVRRRGRRLHVREWLGTAAVAAGLAAFLVAASPSEGLPQTTPTRWALVVVSVAGLMGVGVGLGKAIGGVVRPSLYGLAAASAFGLLAALTKASTHLLGEGASVFFTSWQPYAMAVVAVGGAIVQQSAFQAGPLPASLPVMDAVEPTVAVCIGVFAFNEGIDTSPVALAVQVVAVCTLLIGIVVLDRSPVIAELQSSEPPEPWPQPASRVRSSSA